MLRGIRRRFRPACLGAIAIGALACGALPVAAQDAFPAKLVTVVNPNAPGGTADIITRGMSEPLQRALKQPIVTVNRVGAGGAVGGAYAARAPADGYTVLLNTVTHVLIPITEQVLGRPVPYTPEDFVLLARVTSDPLLFVVHASLPVKNVKELIALAKKRPGELAFSSTGLYGSGHISMAMLMRVANVQMLHTPYNGGGPAMFAVLGGHVFMMHAPAGVASPHIGSGRVRLIAQTGSARLPGLPDTPTLKELGYDVEFLLWAGYFAPAKIAPSVARTWQAALREAAADPKFRDSMAKINVNVDYLDGDAVKAWYPGELARLAGEIRAMGRIEQ